MSEHIMIVGGGLSGLSLAYFLAKRNRSFTILEASNRLGGRIHTIEGVNGTPIEMGATWFSDLHPALRALIEDLGLYTFPQYSGGISLFQTKSFEPPQQFFVPAGEQPSCRIAGGTQALIDALSRGIKDIITDTIVTGITAMGDKVDITTATGSVYQADKVVFCMPPQLVGDRIRFSPQLPAALVALLPTVHTWMAAAIKFALEYKEPFWREAGFSGMLYSHTGIIVEMYDHSNFEDNKFALKGFLNGGAAHYDHKVRKELVLNQLAGLLGKQALAPLLYSDKVWNDEFLISATQVANRPHQNNGHKLLQSGYLEGKVFFAGSETAPYCPGYMEGAVVAAKQLADKL
ncbi:NAD(P)/FAD-dependent oxidoreductase [Chitinophaga sp.]|uniref:flavin monoamine oxidase family protein n=1 Tax=Chitinophaga sp. TaxID=1869181 RepID=UPI0031E4570D